MGNSQPKNHNTIACDNRDKEVAERNKKHLLEIEQEKIKKKRKKEENS